MAGTANAAAQTPDRRPASASLDRVSRAIAAVFAPASQAGGAQTIDQQLPPESPRPFWTERRINLVAGFGAAAAAGVVAFQKERDLRLRKRQIEALPPGSNDEWARQYDEAQRVLKDRNFWGAVAGGVGGVMSAYMFASRSHAIRPLPGGAAFLWFF
jgi:hypothetical protein